MTYDIIAALRAGRLSITNCGAGVMFRIGVTVMGRGFLFFGMQG
jgi:hypothetical protein